jgi:transcription antitermination factor NusG
MRRCCMKRPPAFHPNQEVELLFGPLQGRKGIFVRSVRPARAVVAVQLAHRAVEIEVDRDMIRAAKKRTDRVN